METEDYITQVDGKFSIDRIFNEKKYNFGIFNTYEEALERLNYLEDEGWPISKNVVKQNVVTDDLGLSLDNIEKVEGTFVVFKFINNKKVIFGEFDSIEDAKEIRNNLIDNAWESTEPYTKTKYGKYIRNEHGKFVIRRVYKGKPFSKSFKSLDEALSYREHLVATNWGDLNVPSPMKKTKYIAYNGIMYTIQKVINGKLHVYGFFNDLEDAIEQRDWLINNKWSKLEVPDDSRKYIHKQGNKFLIYKKSDDDIEYFGIFPTFDEAKDMRNKLIMNDWNLNEKSDDIEKISYFIYFDGEFYSIKKEVDGQNRIYGVYKNKTQAIKDEKKLIHYNWDDIYAISNEEYPYGENIVPFDYIFILEESKNGIKKELGRYYSFKDAVIAKNKMIDSSKNIDTNEIVVLKNTIKDKDAIIAAKNETIDELNANIENNSILINDLNNKLNATKKTITDLESDVSAKDKTISDLKFVLRELKSDVVDKTVESNSNNIKDKNSKPKYRSNLFNFRPPNLNKVLEEIIDTRNETIDELNANIENNSILINDLNNKLNATKKTITDLESDVSAKDKKISDLESALRELKSDVVDKTAAESNSNNIFNKILSEFNAVIEDANTSTISIENSYYYKKAITYWDELIKQDPDKDDYYIFKIICLIKLGSYGDIIECCDKAIQLDSKNQIIKDKLNYLILLERYEKLLKIQPNKPAYYFNKAECLYNLRMYEKALSCYNKAIKLLPYDIPNYYFSKAECLCKLNRYNEALDFYNIAIYLKGTDLWKYDIHCFFFSKALCLEKIGDYAEAIIFMKKAIEVDPYDEYTKNKAEKLQEYEQILKLKKMI